MQFRIILVFLAVSSFCAPKVMASNGCEGLIPYYGEYEANATCANLAKIIFRRHLLLTNKIGTLGGSISLGLADGQAREVKAAAWMAFDPTMPLGINEGENQISLTNGLLYSSATQLQYEFFKLTKSSTGGVVLSLDAHSFDFNSRQAHQFNLTEKEIQQFNRQDGKASLVLDRKLTGENQENGTREAGLLKLDLRQRAVEPYPGEICGADGKCRAAVDVGRVNHPCLHGHLWRSATFTVDLSQDWSTYSISGFAMKKCN